MALKEILLISPLHPQESHLRPLALSRALGHETLQKTEQQALSAPLPRWDTLLISPGCKALTALLNKVLKEPLGQRLIIGCRPPKDSSWQEPLKALRGAGLSVLGPASGGLLDGPKALSLCWSQALDTFPPMDGSITLISQGGALGFSLFHMAHGAGARFRRVLSLGAGGDDDALFQALDEVEADQGTDLLILCLEQLAKGRKLMERAGRLVRQGKTVILYRAGKHWPAPLERHPQARQTDELTWQAVARQFGVLLVDDPRLLVNYAKLRRGPKPKGNSLALLASSEGLAMAAYDALKDQNLLLPPLTARTLARLQDLLPAEVPLRNPQNGTVALIKEPWKLEEALNLLHDSPDHDSLALILGPLSGADVKVLAPVLLRFKNRSRKPFLLCLMADGQALGPQINALSAQGLALFASPADLAEAAALQNQVTFPSKPQEPRLTTKGGRLKSFSGPPDEGQALELLTSYGISTQPYELCRRLSDALEAAERLGYPVALKVDSPSFASKTEARALALNLTSPEEVRNAYGRIQERALKAHPDATIGGVIVQKMAQGLECMIGLKRDPLFGPVVAVAPGGPLYALTRDIALRAAPVTPDEARQMILSLRAAPLLTGEWGHPPLALDALAEEIAKLSTLGVLEPDLIEMDINPIFLTETGAAAADAFLRRSQNDR